MEKRLDIFHDEAMNEYFAKLPAAAQEMVLGAGLHPKNPEHLRALTQEFVSSADDEANSGAICD